MFGAKNGWKIGDEETCSFVLHKLTGTHDAQRDVQGLSLATRGTPGTGRALQCFQYQSAIPRSSNGSIRKWNPRK